MLEGMNLKRSEQILATRVVELRRASVCNFPHVRENGLDGDEEELERLF